MSKRIVIALGGNALGNTPYEQLALVTETAKPIVDLIAQGNEVIIAHGNGPQVGMINLGMATAAEAKALKSDMPFPECGAMSQGYIGYHLQNAIGNELASRGMNKDVATVVTQVLVDEADPAFQHPTKPVGAFYDKETADRIAAEKGYTMVEAIARSFPPPSRSTSLKRTLSRRSSTTVRSSSRSAAVASPSCAVTASSTARPRSSTRTSPPPSSQSCSMRICSSS